MTKLAGEAQVTKNGALLRVLPEVTFDKGGAEREVHAGSVGMINGYTEKTKPALLEAKGQLAKGEKLEDWEFDEATVVVTLDTGQRYIMRNAFTLGTPKWSSGKGEIELKVSCTGKPEPM